MMKALTLAALLPTLLPAACAQTSIAAATPLDLCGYNLIFADEFDALDVSDWQLDGKTWMAHTPWRGDFGDARFADPGPEGPFSVKEGILHITARRSDDGKWTSGLLAAADASGKGSGVQYGYFEARLKFPPGSGTWPAFWLMSLQPVKSEPPLIEIDVVEYYGHDDASYRTTWHTYFAASDAAKNKGDGKTIPVVSGSLVSQFHSYGVLVEPAVMTFYFDRNPVWQQPTPSDLDTPLYPLVNLALGSGYSIENTPNSSVMQVDYVRIYEPRKVGENPEECGKGT